ncbi:uncharacterized protein LOC124404172 [Diprion similis]|uniref:uncharacterized protein LOC124404172 n=1 Tax=Diprion similis TaxID=362088 RepID=UPI001EF985C9|nr:uncharacterized protein LOC124404172 [Diprion similis]
MSQQRTIINEMEVVQEALEASLHKVELIEKKLRTKLLTIENRNRLERELEEVKDVLDRNEKALKDLRHENTRSFMIAASFVFACFLLFGLYSMIYGGI